MVIMERESKIGKTSKNNQPSGESKGLDFFITSSGGLRFAGEPKRKSTPIPGTSKRRNSNQGKRR